MAREEEERVAPLRDRAFRHALRDLPAAPTRRRRRLRVGAPVSAFYWGWQLHIPATVVEVRAGRDGDVVDVKFYDGERCVVPADLVRSPEPDVSYPQGACVEAFCAADQQFRRATVTGRRDDLYEVAFDHISGGAVLPPQLLRKPPPRRRPAPPPPRPPRPPPPRDIPPPPRPPPRRSQRLVPAPPPRARRKRGRT